jgi:polyhydroxyalkanoate synthesis regulator phasin
MQSASTIDPCLNAAQKLLKALDLSEKNHVIFRENIATYIAQLKDDFVERLQKEDGQQLVQSLTHAFPYGDMRWGKKLQRDIEKPYSDEEVFSHLETVQKELKQKLEQAKALNPTPFPAKIYVTGSLVKGRFGANSDLDLLADAGDSRIVQPKESFQDQVHIQYLAGGQSHWREAFLNAFGEKVEISLEDILADKPVLQNIYRQVLAQKGYCFDGNSWKIKKHMINRKEVPPPNSAGIAWSFADLPV